MEELSCATESTLCELLADRLHGDEAAQLDAHVDRCGRCRRLVASLVRGSVPTRPLPAPGALIGRYRLIARGGAGAMGVVYAAHDLELNRRVALKLLHYDESERAQQRILREAQALARLQHPNVIRVYETGAFEERVFLAMELVAGGTLTAWLHARPRTPDEIVRVFVRAGRGLWAAHRAGLVHRDFKPENVLVAGDEQVFVTDFGLARVFAPDDQASPLSDGELDDATTVTRSSIAGGTPAYMAPQQLAGRAADAASDQFSFCVTLYEALYGARPFPAKNVAELSALYGRRAAPKLTRGKPVIAARVRRALRRGLALDSTARFADLGALLDELDEDLRTRGAWWAAVALALVAAAVSVSLIVKGRATAQLCRGGPQKMAEVWGGDAHARVRQAFAANHQAFAADALPAVMAALDHYADGWVALQTDACETHRRGEQSSALLDARMQCLEDRRADLRALVDQLAVADDATMAHAAALGRDLVSLRRCADGATLLDRVPLPTDEAEHARMAAVKSQLAQLRALYGIGHYGDAAKSAQSLEPKVRALTYRPLQADAFLGMARAAEADQLEQAARWFNDASRAGEAGRDDRIVTEARVALFGLLGYELRRFPEADAAALAAQAALERLGKDAPLEAALQDAYGRLAVARGTMPAAVDHFRRAVAAVDPATTDPLVYASLMEGLGVALSNVGDSAGSVRMLDQVVALRERVLGPRHPLLASTLSTLGVVLRSTPDQARAAAVLERALAIRRAVLPPFHPDLGVALYNLGAMEADRGNTDHAVALLEEGLRILEKSPTKHDDALGGVLTGLSMLEHRRKHDDTAIRYGQSAVDLLLRADGPHHPAVANAYASLADIDADAGRLASAEKYYRQALHIDEQTLGATNPDLMSLLSALGVGLWKEEIAWRPRRCSSARSSSRCPIPMIYRWRRRA